MTERIYKIKKKAKCRENGWNIRQLGWSFSPRRWSVQVGSHPPDECSTCLIVELKYLVFFGLHADHCLQQLVITAMQNG